MSDDDLNDFEDYGDEQESEESDDDMAQNDENNKIGDITATLDLDVRGVEEVNEKIENLRPMDEDNPLDIDPRPGKYDLCFDRAKPGAKIYVVDVLAETVEDYYESYPDAPDLDTFEGNVVTRMRPEDRVLAAIYVDQSLTSVPDTAYPMPESRLTRLPAEEATLIGKDEVPGGFDRPPLGGGDA